MIASANRGTDGYRHWSHRKLTSVKDIEDFNRHVLCLISAGEQIQVKDIPCNIDLAWLEEHRGMFNPKVYDHLRNFLKKRKIRHIAPLGPINENEIGDEPDAEDDEPEL